MSCAGLFSCACILLSKQQPHPVTKRPGSFYFFFHFALFHPPSLSLSLHLAHICTGERTAVQCMHVGGRPESQVCPAAAAAAGGGGTVDGWRSDGRGPAGLLSGEADSKQTNTCTHTQRKERKKNQESCWQAFHSELHQSVRPPRRGKVTAGWAKEGRRTLRNPSDATNGRRKIKGRAPAWQDGRGRWSPAGIIRVGWSEEGWCSGELEKIRAKRKPKSPCALRLTCSLSLSCNTAQLRFLQLVGKLRKRHVRKGGDGRGGGFGGPRLTTAYLPISLPGLVAPLVVSCSGECMGSVNRQAVGAQTAALLVAQACNRCKTCFRLHRPPLPTGEVMMRGHYQATGETSCKSLNCHNANAERFLLRHKRRDYSAKRTCRWQSQLFLLSRCMIPPSSTPDLKIPAAGA